MRKATTTAIKGKSSSRKRFMDQILNLKLTLNFVLSTWYFELCAFFFCSSAFRMREKIQSTKYKAKSTAFRESMAIGNRQMKIFSVSPCHQQTDLFNGRHLRVNFTDDAPLVNDQQTIGE